MDATALLIALITLCAGVAVGWLAARTRTAGASAAAVGVACSERDAARADLAAARAEVTAARADGDRLMSQLRAAEVREAEAASRVDSLREAQEQLKATFTQLSTEALAKSSSSFLDLADARMKAAGAPLAETLGKVERQMRDIERDRTDAQARLREQIEFVRRTGEDLKQETAALVSALRKPQARGRWGELQLRRCVELAGMTDRCDFTEQATVSSGDGLLRPDMVIRLVGDKHIVVDSKVTLAAYLEAYDAGDDSTRDERLAAHSRHLRQHVDALAAKSYWSQFSATPEFVVLFVPGDAFLAAALDRDPALIDDAFGKRVHIASPTTLISVLRTCAYAWQQDALAANARDVFELGRELYKRLGTLGGHFDKLGRQLTGSVKAYNDTVGSMERQVLVTARKLNALDFTDTEVELAGGVEEPVRPLAAPELLESVEESRTVVVLPPATGTARVESDTIDEAYGLAAGDR
jgi:DNA recombination protein RmuC